MMPFARIHLEEVSEDEKYSLVIQVFLDPTNTPVSSYPYAGWRGIPNPTEWCWPIVFKPDGTVDYGGAGGDDRAERRGEMNIYDRPFKTGAVYVMKHFDGSEPSQFVVRDIRVIEG